MRAAYTQEPARHCAAGELGGEPFDRHRDHATMPGLRKREPPGRRFLDAIENRVESARAKPALEIGQRDRGLGNFGARSERVAQRAPPPRGKARP